MLQLYAAAELYKKGGGGVFGPLGLSSGGFDCVLLPLWDGGFFLYEWLWVFGQRLSLVLGLVCDYL